MGNCIRNCIRRLHAAVALRAHTVQVLSPNGIPLVSNMNIRNGESITAWAIKRWLNVNHGWPMWWQMLYHGDHLLTDGECVTSPCRLTVRFVAPRRQGDN